MIDETLRFLRQHVDERLRVDAGGSRDEAAGDKVVFLDGDKLDPVSFQPNAVTLVLLNLEEERLLRGADPYSRVGERGATLRVQPELRLILHALFIARFKKYDVAWWHLSKVVEHFQHTRVLDRGAAPGMPEGIERLGFELVTMDLARQNEVWSALRTTLHPSLLYRIQLVGYHDRRAVAPAPIDDVGNEVRGLTR